MAGGFGARNRTVPQRHVLDQEIQYEERDHQDGAYDEDPLNSAEKSGPNARVERVEHMRAVVEAAECCFELGPHL